MKWIVACASVAVVGIVLVIGLGSATGEAPGPDQAATPEKGLSASPNPQPQENGKGRKGTRITTDESQFGTMLFNRERQAIYVFGKEMTKKSECYGACAKDWPPVLTKGRPTGGGDTKRGLLGTTKRRDGARQVTYAGQPLYYYAHEGSGQVLCHNVSEFGGLWRVVRPDGDPAD